MDKIVFCKISYMKYYKGVCEADIPINGGRFVVENGYGYEEFNFLSRKDDTGMLGGDKYCLGFVETKSTNHETNNQLHIEKILGVGDAFNKELCVSGVTVVWVATSDYITPSGRSETSVVGWYRDATVYRNYQRFSDEYGEQRLANVFAHADNCVLLPHGERHRHAWWVPTKKYTRSFGFGQSMLWYASEEQAQPYLKKLQDNITAYDGENWLYKEPPR